MMFVLPMMLFKGLHWGYTRFFLMRFNQPITQTDDEKLRRFDKEDTTPAAYAKASEPAVEVEADEESACPVAPALKLFGLYKTKPAGHPPSAKAELISEINTKNSVKAQ